MSNYETVIYEKVEDKIFRLTLNRPEKLNALSPKLLTELEQVLDVYEDDPEASVLIIRGAGRAFSAGYDLNAPAVPGQKFTISNDRVNMQRLVTRWQRLWSCAKPTIAQVHGFCLAGATEFVGHCDIVFASEDATFGHPAGRKRTPRAPDDQHAGFGIVLVDVQHLLQFGQQLGRQCVEFLRTVKRKAEDLLFDFLVDDGFVIGHELSAPL